jgi:D-xylose 1-dehydrogenase (NADP+, D-xylono-1,5-lactone-forming)
MVNSGSARGHKQLRWGVIATGRIAADVMPGLQRSQVNEVVAVASRDSARARAFADRYGLPFAYGSYERLMADADIDCLYVCLPNGLHAEWVRRALEAGKHVLCEKPLTPTAGEAENLFAVAAARGLVLAEAFMYRHHPKTHRLAALVSSGDLGEIHTIRASFNFWTENPRNDIRYSVQLNGGALLDVGSYCVNLANYLQGCEPAHVSGVADLADSGVEERFYGMLHYPSGCVAMFDCSMQSPLSVGVSVLGTRGEAIVAMPWYAHREPHSIEVRYPGSNAKTLQAAGDNAYFLETEDFAAAVLGRKAPEVSAAETIRTLRTIDRLRASSSYRRAEQLGAGQRDKRSEPGQPASTR